MTHWQQQLYKIQRDDIVSKELTVSGLIDLRSWCLALLNSGSECGRLKSPMRSEFCSDVDSAWYTTASELQRTRRRPPACRWTGLILSCEQLNSRHSLARFTVCFDDVGVSGPTQHAGLTTYVNVWPTAGKFSQSSLSTSFTPRRRLRPDTATASLSVTQHLVTEQRELKSIDSAKPSSASVTGDSTPPLDW